MLSKKQLKNAVTEFNIVMGLNPELDDSGTIEELTEKIKIGIPYIDPITDVFSAETQAVIREFSKHVPAPPVEEETDEDDDVGTRINEAADDVEAEEPTADYVNQAKEVATVPRKVVHRTSDNIEYFDHSNVIDGLVIGSKVRFIVAPNSRVYAKQKLTGEVLKIKMAHNKSENEVVQIKTKVGIFYKYTKAVALC